MDAAEREWLVKQATQLGLSVKVKAVHGDSIWTSIGCDGQEFSYALDLKLLRAGRIWAARDGYVPAFVQRLRRIRDELAIKTWLLPATQPWVWDGRDA